MRWNYVSVPNTVREHQRTHTRRHTHQPTDIPPASTCRLCGEEIRQHQMHNTVLISMPTNLTQSKKVTLCRNKKKASLFQNCMLGSLQADRFNEWNSLKRNAFHPWLTTLCRRWNWKTILISDHRNDSDTRQFFFLFSFSCQKSSPDSLSCMKKLRLSWAEPNSVSQAPPQLRSLCPFVRLSLIW